MVARSVRLGVPDATPSRQRPLHIAANLKGREICSVAWVSVGTILRVAMITEELIERVKSLSAEEQTLVLQFIDYLERRHTSPASPFLQAAEEFIAEHPELLRRLSQ